jgi:hypothetical protein
MQYILVEGVATAEQLEGSLCTVLGCAVDPIATVEVAAAVAVVVAAGVAVAVGGAVFVVGVVGFVEFVIGFVVDNSAV